MTKKYIPDKNDVEDFSVFYATAHASSDESFHEMTSKKGDVILMHPLMLHSASKNGRRIPRRLLSPFASLSSALRLMFLTTGIITNPPVSLAAPFQFNKSNPAEYSLIELKTMQDLGGPEKFKDWKITGKREMFLPSRFGKMQDKCRIETDRLRAKGIDVGEELLDQTPHVMRQLLIDQRQGLKAKIKPS